MALLDHFRTPLSHLRHWHAFHNAWATYLASDLNQRLPEGYFAEPNVQFGIEIDVATFEEAGTTPDPRGREGMGLQLTVLPKVWTAPDPTLTLPLSIITETVEVLVYDREAGPTLVGAIELVSPANQDRPSYRDAFVFKCAGYLQQGIGLVVNVVTDWRANLHDESIARLRSSEGASWDAELYATAYRPVMRDGQTQLDIWQETLAVGHALPTMPLWLRGNLCLPVELGAAYDRTCREQRIGANGT